jgi:hypothetical protein
VPEHQACAFTAAAYAAPRTTRAATRSIIAVPVLISGRGRI